METYFKVKTPLNVEVRTTKDYWKYLITRKHNVLHNKEKVVIETLKNPDDERI